MDKIIGNQIFCINVNKLFKNYWST